MVGKAGRFFKVLPACFFKKRIMAVCNNINCKKEFTPPDWALEPVFGEFCQKCVFGALKKEMSKNTSSEDVVKREFVFHCYDNLSVRLIMIGLK